MRASNVDPATKLSSACSSPVVARLCYPLGYTAPSSLQRALLLICSVPSCEAFNMWGKGGSERKSNLPRVTQLISKGVSESRVAGFMASALALRGLAVTLLLGEGKSSPLRHMEPYWLSILLPLRGTHTHTLPLSCPFRGRSKDSSHTFRTDPHKAVRLLLSSPSFPTHSLPHWLNVDGRNRRIPPSSKKVWLPSTKRDNKGSTYNTSFKCRAFTKNTSSCLPSWSEWNGRLVTAVPSTRGRV